MPPPVRDIRPTTGHVLHMTGIDQADLESASFQDLEQRNPVNASGFHCDRADSAGREPVGQSVQIWSKRGETSDRLRVAIFWHGHVHFGRAHIDAGSIGLHDAEGRIGWIELGSFSRHSHLSLSNSAEPGRPKLLKLGSLLNGIVGLQNENRRHH